MAARMLALALVLLAASGCLGGTTSETTSAFTTPSTTMSSANATTAADSAPLTATLYLTADRKLTFEVPAAGSVDQGQFVVDYFQGQVDPTHYQWRSDPLPQAVMVLAQPVTVNIWFESDAPIPPAPGNTATQGGGFFGSSKGMPVYAFKDGAPGPFMPGTPTQFEVIVDNAPPRAPLVIPAGETFTVFAGLNALTTDESPARLLVGGERASSVTFTYVTLGSDPLAGAGPGLAEKAAGIFVTPEDAPLRHAFSIAANASFVEVKLRLTAGHSSDLDLHLLNSAGDILSSSTTPATFESIYLAGPALDGLRGTEVIVQVSHFNSAQATYEVTFTQG